jgi:prefoldin subunit 5
MTDENKVQELMQAVQAAATALSAIQTELGLLNAKTDSNAKVIETIVSEVQDMRNSGVKVKLG